ncbi:hypothetical protein Cgig2_009490 [Carnegiea gigantea]|uniref:Uncharacterized protein n=1 Tax=Carnegiea gigantea TaxID=171969 RepID=A0A9Q1GTU0_9CARY|nr:hypothetical protein Cgig2_009490 [Carnegiea gigantea]
MNSCGKSPISQLTSRSIVSDADAYFLCSSSFLKLLEMFLVAEVSSPMTEMPTLDFFSLFFMSVTFLFELLFLLYYMLLLSFDLVFSATAMEAVLRTRNPENLGSKLDYWDRVQKLAKRSKRKTEMKLSGSKMNGSGSSRKSKDFKENQRILERTESTLGLWISCIKTYRVPDGPHKLRFLDSAYLSAVPVSTQPDLCQHNPGWIRTRVKSRILGNFSDIAVENGDSGRRQIRTKQFEQIRNETFFLLVSSDLHPEGKLSAF